MGKWMGSPLPHERTWPVAVSLPIVTQFATQSACYYLIFNYSLCSANTNSNSNAIALLAHTFFSFRISTPSSVHHNAIMTFTLKNRSRGTRSVRAGTTFHYKPIKIPFFHCAALNNGEDDASSHFLCSRRICSFGIGFWTEPTANTTFASSSRTFLFSFFFLWFLVLPWTYQPYTFLHILCGVCANELC